MKKIVLLSFLFICSMTYAQSTAMIAILLEDGKEAQYLAQEKGQPLVASIGIVL